MIKGHRCNRCGKEWVSNKDNDTPIVCPKCKSPYWNKPKHFQKTPSKNIIGQKGITTITSFS